MKKIVKLLPVTLALMLAVPAFAAEMQTTKDTQSTELSITLPDYFDIQVTPGTVTTAATFQDDYSTISLNEALGTSFKVITNDASAKVALTAKAGNTSANALYGTASDLKVVFGNTSSTAGSVAAQDGDVAKITATSGATPAASPNVFALSLATATCTGSGAASGTVSPSINAGSGTAVYSLQNGIYDFVYLTGTTAVDDSFNTYDTYGKYTATLTLSKYTIGG